MISIVGSLFDECDGRFGNVLTCVVGSGIDREAYISGVERGVGRIGYVVTDVEEEGEMIYFHLNKRELRLVK